MDKKIIKLIGFILLALVLFYGILLFFGGEIAGVIFKAIYYGKYNTMFVSEIVLLLFALLMLAIRKRLGTLKYKGKSFSYGIKRGIPIFVVSIISLLGSLTGIIGEEINISNLISLILLAITIGMAEEFFFRGLIQDEIVDAYGKTRREVIKSIIISGGIFGLVHLSNALGGQDFITTTMQVLQASSLGILLGSIYYVTKNIWTVVFLHSFYDFAILLGEVNSYKDCINNPEVSHIMLLFTVVGTVAYSIIYLVGAYLNLQRRHVNEYINESVSEEVIKSDKENATKAKKLVVVVIVFFFLFSYLVPVEETTNMQICYSYESIDIDGEVSFALDNEFILNYVKLYVDNYILDVESLDGENKIQLEYLDDIYDIYVYEYENNYHILLNSNEILYYGVISKEQVKFSDEFISTIGKSFKTYDVPAIMDIGKLENDTGTYPLMKSYVSDYFIIKDDKVMVRE